MAGEFYISNPTGNFDYQPYLDTLREAKTIPIKQLQSDQTLMQAKQQALDAVKGKVDALLGPLETLDDPKLYDTLKAKVADTSVASASVSSDAIEGEYALETIDLARANAYKIASISSVSDIDSPFTEDGTLSINYNKDGVATAISIDYKDKSLRDIMDAINAGGDLNASLVNLGDNGGYQLLVSAGETGTDNVITSVDDSLNGGDDAAGVFSENVANTYETISAVDAKIKLGGIEFTNATNDFADILTGVSITAKSVGSTTLTVEKDSGAIKKALDGVLEGYNALVDTVRSATGQGAVLAGESSLNSIVNAAFRALSDKLGAHGLLQTTGTADATKAHLKIDAAALETFMNDENFADVLQGFADSLQTRMDGYSTSLNRREQSYQSRLDSINERIYEMGKKIDSDIESMRIKFVRLQTFMSEMSDVQQRISQFAGSMVNNTNSNT
jgi:flagellar hook-associated protein 2